MKPAHQLNRQASQPGAHAPATDEDETERLRSQCEEDLRSTIARHGGLFPADVFDGRLPRELARAVVAQAPGSTAALLAHEARASLWVFPVDWLIDTRASSREEVRGLRRRCLDVAAGADPGPGDAVGAFLAELRDGLDAFPAFAERRPLWRRHLDAMLTAMVREWEWRFTRGADDPPTFEEYRNNADNFGSTWVNVVHWTVHDDPGVAECLPELVAASQHVQEALRLFNDLATWKREKGTGDLNALRLVSPDVLRRRIGELLTECAALIDALAGRCPAGADYLRRQLRFSDAFYSAGEDYWRRL
ncbi:terpene synthase family protein [Actinomadura chibensis]|uniref:Terpene synthase n=1 Tax=Actinomadura chibensis TaxID=392828 RepID=A0A5D0NM37_9ACTN|nr:terpene synthase family protein [Actinomadura chibensis]TYB45563.1 terpene synthase [Actinomadura chibensis]